MKEKSLNYYKGQAFKLFTEHNNWKYEALKEMLNTPNSIFANDTSLLSKWWNMAIDLHKLAYQLFDALESYLSFRAFRRAAQLLDMWEYKVQQVVNYMESLER